MDVTELTWSEDKTFKHNPAAVLRAGERVVMKVYLSPNRDIIRIVLAELVDQKQIKVLIEDHIIDFRRTP